MKHLIRRYLGSGKVTMPSDNTRVNLPPALVTPLAQKTQAKKRKKLIEEHKLRLTQKKLESLESSINVTKLALGRKHAREEADRLAFLDIKDRKFDHARMDQTTQQLNSPEIQSTYLSTPELQHINTPVYGYEDAAGDVMSTVLTAPFGGAALKGTAKWAFHTPWARRLIYDTAANEALKGSYSFLTDRDLGLDINYVMGFDPDNPFGEFTAFGLATAGRKAAIKGGYNLLLLTPQAKRLAEVGMSLSSYADGLDWLRLSIRYRHMPTVKAANKDKLKYILTGEAPLDPVRRYGVFGSGYTGIDGHPRVKKGLVLTYIYGTPLNPQFATFKGFASKVKPKLHNDYIDLMYPHKKHKIQVYEIGETPAYEARSAKYRYDDQGITLSGHTDDLPSLDPNYEFNTLGHYLHFDPVTKQATASDIWKFLPQEYREKWVNNTSYLAKPFETGPIKIGPFKIKNISLPVQKLYNMGLKFIDDIGTPIVLETKPRVSTLL